MSLLVINGKGTFGIKDKLKALGMKWNPKYKSWNSSDSLVITDVWNIIFYKYSSEIESGSIRMKVYNGNNSMGLSCYKVDDAYTELMESKNKVA